MNQCGANKMTYEIKQDPETNRYLDVEERQKMLREIQQLEQLLEAFPRLSEQREELEKKRRRFENLTS